MKGKLTKPMKDLRRIVCSCGRCPRYCQIWMSVYEYEVDYVKRDGFPCINGFGPVDEHMKWKVREEK